MPDKFLIELGAYAVIKTLSHRQKKQIRNGLLLFSILFLVKTSKKVVTSKLWKTEIFDKMP